ncbi:hypothetical protein [Haladaptatus halobius]|uniref:hypothetical protein n=1 Tax=Haladaptatus halobius TaxID=2884875 RepID=UPI001D0AF8BD|nr:hypothetical protein [Haladaptatus halobius]
MPAERTARDRFIDENVRTPKKRAYRSGLGSATLRVASAARAAGARTAANDGDGVGVGKVVGWSVDVGRSVGSTRVGRAFERTAVVGHHTQS